MSNLHRAGDPPMTAEHWERVRRHKFALAVLSIAAAAILGIVWGEAAVILVLALVLFAGVMIDAPGVTRIVSVLLSLGAGPKHG